MIGRFLDRKTLGDESLPSFEMDDSTMISQTENSDDHQLYKNKYGNLIFLGCFLLGVFVSHIVTTKCSAHHKLSQSSFSVLQLATEETPLVVDDENLADD